MTKRGESFKSNRGLVGEEGGLTFKGSKDQIKKQKSRRSKKKVNDPV